MREALLPGAAITMSVNERAGTPTPVRAGCGGACQPIFYATLLCPM